MGWTYPFGATLKGLIAERTEGFEIQYDNGVTFKATCIAKCFKGALTHKGVLWTVWEHTWTKSDGTALWTTERPCRFIGCDLMECSVVNGLRSWGYKDMDESMHPYYYSCPEKYLKMTPVACQEWRNEVEEHHKRRRAKLALKRKKRKLAS